ncbi:MAG: hypothetical protein WC284_12810 [Candidimonas sp.]
MIEHNFKTKIIAGDIQALMLEHLWQNEINATLNFVKFDDDWYVRENWEICNAIKNIFFETDVVVMSKETTDSSIKRLISFIQKNANAKMGIDVSKLTSYPTTMDKMSKFQFDSIDFVVIRDSAESAYVIFASPSSEMEGFPDSF